MEKVIGIDLGTTNSCVAIIENGTPTVIPTAAGTRPRRRWSQSTEAGKRLVGHIAQAAGHHQRREYGVRGQAP